MGILGKKEEKSLYERLGGYNAIAAVVDDFVGRLVADKQLGYKSYMLLAHAYSS